MLELLVVAVDGAAIKLVATFEFFQGNGFRGVSWRRAGVISLIGNTASFFVGVIASGAIAARSFGTRSASSGS